MSIIYGIFNRDGKKPEHLTQMQNAISYWEADENGNWSGESVSLAHAMLWNTPESKYEHLPYQKDAHVLTMDARIDNRGDLVKELDLPDRPLHEIGDSEFILAAYRKWGEKCPEHLLGDFAFVIWDEKKQKLFCARDPLGIKLFHYYIDDGLFVFSSDILGVLSHPNVPKDYDEKILSIFLRDNGIHSQRDTFFDKIKKLSNGTSLTIRADTVSERSYWQIQNIVPIRYDTYQEYVDALRTLLESAVEVRLRTAYPIVSHLSGGIDSSPIAVLAARKLKQKQQSLYAYNWINIPQNSEEYELEAYEFSRRIAKQEQIEHHEFEIDSSYMAQWYDTHDITTQGNMFYMREYYVQNEAEKIGARTIISGWGGDELISYNGYSYISGLFKQGKFINALKVLHEEKKLKKYSWLQFVKRCANEMDIPLLRNYLRWRNKKPLELYENNDYAYIKKDFREVMKKYSFEEFPNVFGVRKRQMNLLNYGHIQNRIESWGLSAFSKRTEYCYPLLDRRIVEFALGVPEDLFFTKNGHYRYLMRSAVADLLPSDIAWFPKANVIKGNITYKRQYKDALEIWYQKHKNDDALLYDNPYVEYDKIISALKVFDFRRSDVYSLYRIVVAILVSNIMKKT